MNKDTFCSFCGNKFAEQKLWPRKCFHCGNDTYRNPTPVVVAMVPVDAHLPQTDQWPWLIHQRNIEPMKGGWAFPSGYIDFGETWQQAASRELQEEVGLLTKPEDFHLLEVVNSVNGNMLIFCVHNKIVRVEDIQFQPNDEVSAIDFILQPSKKQLCFPTHNEVWDRYFNSLD